MEINKPILDGNVTPVPAVAFRKSSRPTERMILRSPPRRRVLAQQRNGPYAIGERPRPDPLDIGEFLMQNCGPIPRSSQRHVRLGRAAVSDCVLVFWLLLGLR